MIHIAIVEDERDQLALLGKYVKQFSQEEGRPVFLHEFADGEDLLEDFAPGKYDLLLLDIRMRRMDGMEAARRVREMDKDVLIIFITNMIQCAVQGYSVHALDFVVKPVSYPSFRQKLRGAFSRIRHREESMVRLKTLEGSLYLDRGDIYTVETEGRRLLLRTAGGEYRYSGSMQSMEDILCDLRFFRVHVGCLVNLKHVRTVEKYEANVAGIPVPISKHRKKEFMDALTNYMGKDL